MKIKCSGCCWLAKGISLHFLTLFLTAFLDFLFIVSQTWRKKGKRKKGCSLFTDYTFFPFFSLLFYKLEWHFLHGLQLISNFKFGEELLHSVWNTVFRTNNFILDVGYYCFLFLMSDCPSLVFDHISSLSFSTLWCVAAEEFHEMFVSSALAEMIIKNNF